MKINFEQLTILDCVNEIKKNNTNTFIKDLHNYHKAQIEKYKNLNAIIAEDVNYLDQNSNKLFFAIKDNFFLKGRKTTASSKVLQNFVAPFTSTVLERLSTEFDFPIKTNMDEFAMGDDGIHSIFGKAFSPWKLNNEHLSPGGSSSGSAIAVSTGMAMASIGSDTGGSVRRPATLCGIVGYKPTYGILSRYGLIPLSNNLDSPGFFTRTVADSEYLLSKTMGEDVNDGTTIDGPNQTINLKKKIFFYVPKESNSDLLHTMDLVKEHLKTLNFELVFKNLDLLEDIVSLYYSINAVESFTNLVRFKSNIYSTEEHHTGNNLELLGKEVKRRMLSGAYITRYHKDLYFNALKKSEDIFQTLKGIFQEYDAIILPTLLENVTINQVLNDSNYDPYANDKFTVLANLVGMPAINIPINLNNDNLPMSIQMITMPKDDLKLLHIAKIIDQHFNFYCKFGSMYKNL